MIKLPKYLQEKIYVDVREANQKNQTITVKDIIAKYKSEFENRKLKEIDIVNGIKAIKKWIYVQPNWISLKYPPLNKPRHQRITNYLEQQKNIINNNNAIIEKQNVAIKKNKKKQEKIDAQIKYKEADLIGYDQAMYLQKRFIGLMKTCQCKVDQDFNVMIEPDKQTKYDLLDANLLMLAIKSLGEIKNGSKVDFSKLFFDILKESEKLTMFFQQQNLIEKNNDVALSLQEDGDNIERIINNCVEKNLNNTFLMFEKK